MPLAVTETNRLRLLSCQCSDGREAVRDHHDRLLRVERDRDEVLGLLELAVTYGELDYSTEPVIPPAEWPEFAELHGWHDPEYVSRLFSLAHDVAVLSVGRGRAPR